MQAQQAEFPTPQAGSDSPRYHFSTKSHEEGSKITQRGIDGLDDRLLGSFPSREFGIRWRRSRFSPAICSLASRGRAERSMRV